MANDGGSASGLSANEAKEVHRFFMLGFIVFTVIAIIAHILVWQWRPWFPGPDGYAAITDGIQAVANSAITRFT